MILWISVLHPSNSESKPLGLFGTLGIFIPTRFLCSSKQTLNFLSHKNHLTIASKQDLLTCPSRVHSMSKWFTKQASTAFRVPLGGAAAPWTTAAGSAWREGQANARNGPKSSGLPIKTKRFTSPPLSTPSTLQTTTRPTSPEIFFTLRTREPSCKILTWNA